MIETPDFALLLMTPDQNLHISVFSTERSKDFLDETIRRKDYVFKLYLPEEWKALNDLVNSLDESFCRLFANGLTADDMKQRLMKHAYYYDHSPVEYSALLTRLHNNTVNDLSKCHYPYVNTMNELIYQFFHCFIMFNARSPDSYFSIEYLQQLIKVIDDTKTVAIIEHYLKGIQI